jgi:hypothetical protein
MSVRTGRSLGTALAALLLTAAAAPESNLEQYFRLRGEGAKAAQANDLVTAEVRFEQALALYPTAPGSFIRLARVEVAAGKPQEAIAHLAEYARLGLVWNIPGDPVLKALVAEPAFAPVAARLAENAQPVGQVTRVATLGPAGAVNEGVAPDGDGWLVSAVAGRSIIRVGAVGRSDLLTPDTETGGLFGLATDARRGVLWAAESRGPGIPGSGPGSGAPRRTGLLKLSLKDGRVLARFLVPDDGEDHQIGDVTVDDDGTVYASDSIGAVIYRLLPGEAQLKPFLTTKDMASPQGMAICPGTGSMVIADYSTGLHRLDLKTGVLTPVGGLRAALAGTDGLFRVEYDFHMRSASPHPVALVAVQNGVSPQRLMFLRLSLDCEELEDATVLAANLAETDDLTLGVDGGGRVLFIGASGWADRDGDGKLTTDTPRTAGLFSIPLPQ